MTDTNTNTSTSTNTPALLTCPAIFTQLASTADNDTKAAWEEGRLALREAYSSDETQTLGKRITTKNALQDCYRLIPQVYAFLRGANDAQKSALFTISDGFLYAFLREVQIAEEIVNSKSSDQLQEKAQLQQIQAAAKQAYTDAMDLRKRIVQLLESVVGSQKYQNVFLQEQNARVDTPEDVIQRLNALLDFTKSLLESTDPTDQPAKKRGLLLGLTQNTYTSWLQKKTVFEKAIRDGQARHLVFGQGEIDFQDGTLLRYIRFLTRECAAAKKLDSTMPHFYPLTTRSALGLKRNTTEDQADGADGVEEIPQEPAL